MPSGSSTSRMSAKTMAASTPSWRAARTVTSAASSGVRQSVTKSTLARISRYQSW